MRLFVITALLLLLAAEAWAYDLKLSWCVPCFQPKSACCDSLSDTLETSLRWQRVSMVRFRDNDTLAVGVVPEIGRECTRDSALFWIEPDSTHGSVGAVLLYSVDIAGNVSCHYSSYVFAVPMAHR